MEAMIMNKKIVYTGIDYFRIIAAFLVIAIHTSPLLSYNDTADFILTGILARTAVPFFFMASGFFLISAYSYNSDKLKSFIKKTSIIYGIAIVIYIPINIYNGYFNMDSLLPNIVKDVVFDGTLYHLWYLPAAIIGAIISWLLVNKLGFKFAFITTFVLYIIGLFGDSYFGISAQIPVLESFYNSLFEISEYTRNGIFFAPIFFVLGGIIANKKIHIPLKHSLIGLAITLPLLFIETLILHNLDIPRHDSMYIMLVPCMFFLFKSLIFVNDRKGNKVTQLRTASLIIYIIHPMMIVVVRFAAKLVGLQKLLIDNSLLHFFTVSVMSVAITYIILLIKKKYKRKSIVPTNTDRAWIEVDLDNLRHNAVTLQTAMPDRCKLMAVVKAEGYGHGATVISTYLNRIGVTAFAVATIDEGISLRKSGVKGEILIMGYTSPFRAKEICKYNFVQTLIDYDYTILLNRQGYDIKAHIKIDTGMHRLGFDPNDIEKAAKAFKLKNIHICGIYTHLSASQGLDMNNVKFTHTQILRFYGFLEMLLERGITIPKVHIQSSYGLLNYPQLKCDYARIGIALYGVHSSEEDITTLQLDLRPVLSLKSRISLIREVDSGESVGYDMKFVAGRDSRIALLPIGYADGLPRNLSCGKCNVLVHGYFVPIIGQICMDQLLIDITDIPDVRIGDIATLIGKDGENEIHAREIATNADSITNELLSRMGHRLKSVEK